MSKSSLHVQFLAQGLAQNRNVSKSIEGIKEALEHSYSYVIDTFCVMSSLLQVESWVP